MAKSSTKASEGSDLVVKVEDAGPSRKKLNFTIPAAKVTEQIENSLGVLMTQASVPGFRPGRAPRRIVEKRFGSSLREEAKNQLVSAAYSKAIQDNKIEVLTEPEGNEELAKLQIESGKDLKFYLEVDVMPEFELPNLDGLEIYRPLIEPTEDQVDDQIEKLAINEGSLEEQKKASPGDYCIGHGTMRDKDGEVLIDIEGAVIQVPPTEKKGEGAILGVMVSDFGTQIGLPSPGDTLSVTTKGPENHEDERVRGKDLIIEFKVSQVQRIMPCPMDELLRRTGAPTEEQLRESMMTRLKQRAQVEQHSALRQQVSKHLVDSVEVPVPERLSARQATQNLNRARMELMYRGMDDRVIEERMAQLRAATAAAAVRDLKLSFILARITQQLKIEVSRDEVLGRVAQMAFERGVRPDAMRQELEKRNQLMFVAQQVREHKTVDALVQKSKVTDMPLEEFNAKFGSGKPAPAAAVKKTSKKKSAAT